MSDAPWINGTVEGVAASLRESRDRFPSNSGIVHASAIGMIASLVRSFTPRSEAERLADIRTVLDALDVVIREELEGGR